MKKLIAFGVVVVLISLVQIFGPEKPADNWIEAVERWPDAQGYITDNFGRTTPITTFFPEPNEPKYYNFQATISRDIPPDTALVLWVSPGSKFHKAIEEQPEPMKYSLPIPTWPDYIELDKDLVIESPPIMFYIGGTEIPWECIETISKGTKIYFKEDD